MLVNLPTRPGRLPCKALGDNSSARSKDTLLNVA